MLVSATRLAQASMQSVLVLLTSNDVHEVGVLRERVPLDGDVVLDQHRRVLDTGTDDGDEGGRQDASERDKSPKRQLAPFSRVRDLLQVSTSDKGQTRWWSLTATLKTAMMSPHQTPQMASELNDLSAFSPPRTCEPAKPMACDMSARSTCHDWREQEGDIP